MAIRTPPRQRYEDDWFSDGTSEPVQNPSFGTQSEAEAYGTDHPPVRYNPTQPRQNRRAPPPGRNANNQTQQSSPAWKYWVPLILLIDLFFITYLLVHNKPPAAPKPNTEIRSFTQPSQQPKPELIEPPADGLYERGGTSGTGGSGSDYQDRRYRDARKSKPRDVVRFGPWPSQRAKSTIKRLNRHHYGDNRPRW